MSASGMNDVHSDFDVALSASLQTTAFNTALFSVSMSFEHSIYACVIFPMSVLWYTVIFRNETMSARSWPRLDWASQSYDIWLDQDLTLDIWYIHRYSILLIYIDGNTDQHDPEMLTSAHISQAMDTPNPQRPTCPNQHYQTPHLKTEIPQTIRVSHPIRRSLSYRRISPWTNCIG